MTDTPSAEQVAREVSRVMAETGGGGSLANDSRLAATLQNIETIDRGFQQQGGVFFQTGANAFETAERFTQIHVEQYRETGRPSLPALAVHHAEKLGLDKGSPEYKAMILVAVRAEMETAIKPDYHSKNHFLDVAAMTANLLEKNNEQVAKGGGTPLTRQEAAVTFIAAIGHDLDHEGKSNPGTDPLFNEKKSFAIMEPLLKEAGLTPAQIADAQTILMTTSPNGPHAILKTMAKGERDGQPVTIADVREMDRRYNEEMVAKGNNMGLKPLDFPELASLDGNKKLIQMAAMVSDADLYASGGAGMNANRVMSALLTAEGKNYMNSPLDFTTDGSRMFFLDGIVGKEGFASDAGREVANETFKAMRAETNDILAAKALAAAEAKIKAEADAKKKGPGNGDGPDGNNGGGSTPVEPAGKPVTPAGGGGEQKPVASGDQKPVASGDPKPAAAETPPPASRHAAEAPTVKSMLAAPPAARAPVVSHATQAKLGHGAGVAQVAVDVASGNYGAAATGASMQIAMNAQTYEAAATLTSKIAPVAKGLGFVGKKIPIVGAFVTAGFVLYEAGAEAYNGNYGRAGAALGAGAAETVGNIVGFGVGDAAREVVREGVVRTAGEEFAPQKSGIRQLAEGAYDVGSKFVSTTPAAETPAPATAAATTTASNKPRPKGPSA